MATSRRSVPLVALVLAALVLIINAPIVAGGKTWADRRYHTEVAPPRLAAAEAVQRGMLPAWWDGSGLGVPLASEPTHGALYPPTWIAATPRALDGLLVAHFLWAALGIAMWARRRGTRDGASEPAAVIVALLAVASGLYASTAVRGALPAIAQLPWIGLAASALADAEDRRGRARATIALALALGLCGLGGVLGVLVDGVVIALAAARKNLRHVAIAIAAGLAVAAAQWVPALVGDGAGATVHAIPLGRLVELIVPGSFGASDPDRAHLAIAGTHAWAPSLFVGPALLSLAAVRTPTRRMLAAIGLFVVLALVVGRGGWPAWLGAPEVHVAALVVVLAVNAAPGLDDLVAGKRRALFAALAGTAFATLALGALGVLRMRAPSVALDRALVDGGIAVACLAIALVLAWRGLAAPVIFALLLLSSAGSVPSTHPTIERFDRPGFAVAAATRPTVAPLRVFRPVTMGGIPDTIDDAIATLAGATPSTWGLAAARSEDPARLPIHDRAWLAAAREGGALLDRFGIELAILPETVVASQKLEVLASRGSWKLVRLPVAPPAAVLAGAQWSVDASNALDLMYPAAGGTGVLRGTVVLAGRGRAAPDRGGPVPCTIDRWDPGAIDLSCTGPGYAAVSSTPSLGWSVTLDDVDTPWLTADVLRRAAYIDAGPHRIAWRYTAPGLRPGLLLAAIALLGLIAIAVASRR